MPDAPKFIILLVLYSLAVTALAGYAWGRIKGARR